MNPNVLNLEYTSTFLKLDACVKRKRKFIIMQGSSRSGKTYAAIQLLCLLALRTPHKLSILIVRKHWTDITNSVLRDFEEILTTLTAWNRSNYNGSEHIYRLGQSIFTFIGLDSKDGEAKAKGVKSDIAFINECDQIEEKVIDQIMLRNTTMIIFDFNPNVSDKHWIYTKIENQVDRNGNRVSERFISTFRDNPAIVGTPQEDTILSYQPTPENIKRGTADATFWRIYGCGEQALVEGLVYPEDKYTTLSEWPRDVGIIAYGLDFGFTNDPTGMTAIGYGTGPFKGNLYVDEIFHKVGLITRSSPQNEKQGSIEDELKSHNISKEIPIYCDSSDPKAISELKLIGYNALPVIKGAGSIMSGINTVSRFKMYITNSSTNLLKELANYKWRTDRNGRSLNEPVDRWNHLCDSLRYSCSMTCDLSDASERGSFQIDSGIMSSSAGNYDLINPYSNSDSLVDRMLDEHFVRSNNNIWLDM